MRRNNRLLTLMLALVVVMGIATVSIHTMDGGKEVVSDETTSADVTQAPQTKAADAKDSEREDALALFELDLTVTDAAGGTHTLADVAAGRPLVVNVWATWCPYCVQEMPDLARVAEEYGDRVGFLFLDATDGRRETREDALAWLAEHEMAELPVYFDEGLGACRALAVTSYPTTLVTDAEGHVVTYRLGVVDVDALCAALDELVGA